MANIKLEPTLNEEYTDFYNVLGVATSATHSEIRRRYTELSKLYHPDKARNQEERNQNTRLYERIKMAYEILGDAEKREEYTRLLQSTFDDLRGEYVQGPVPVEQNKVLTYEELLKFNQQFIETNEIERFTTNVVTLDFETFLANRDRERESLEYRNCVFSQQFPISEIEQEVKQLMKMIEDKLNTFDRESDKSEVRISSDYASLKSFSLQLREIKEGVRENILLVVDFVKACEKCQELGLSINSKLMESLKSQINYERPEWSQVDHSMSTGGTLAPFNDHIDYGCNLANNAPFTGSLLNC